VAEARLDPVLRLARARSPELREMRERSAAVGTRSGTSASLAEPELQLQLWQQPLGKPFAALEAARRGARADLERAAGRRHGYGQGEEARKP